MTVFIHFGSDSKQSGIHATDPVTAESVNKGPKERRSGALL